MRLQVLISCMHLKDFSILSETNIKSDVLIINQCDFNNVQHFENDTGEVKIINTTERGLSRSRNKAISASTDDICLLCDDDEVLVDNYSQLILDTFQKFVDYDIICFVVSHESKKYSNKIYDVGYLRALQISSWQIAFRNTDKIKNIKFDERFGSGTGNGAGEENIFLFDCLKAGCKIKYVPINIGMVKQEKSNWFKGYTETYFLQRGIVSRRLFGPFLGLLYCIYHGLFKYNVYKNDITIYKALKNMIQGVIKYKNYNFALSRFEE